MTPEQFAYWLQGFVETNSGNPPNVWQWKMIKDHLQTCFNKVTPNYPSNPYAPPWTVTCSNSADNMPLNITADGKKIYGGYGGGSKRNGGGGAC